MALCSLIAESVSAQTAPRRGSVQGTTSSCTGTGDLVGTGFQITDPGNCNANSLVGGAIAWLTARGNVVPGETIELQFALWDTSDGYYDSVVLLDHFQWSDQATTPGAFIAP